jgi:uncharacterized protein YciI
VSDIVRPGTPLCLIMLTYIAPIEQIDALMPAHGAWLRQLFAEDLIVVCGRREPRNGGIIVCRGRKADVEALAATDPFVTEGVATIEVSEFAASMAHPALADLLA